MKKVVDLTEGNLFKKIIIFAIPIMASGMLQLFYNAADLIVCGKFGTEHAIAAVSSTTPLVHLLVNTFVGISVGSNALMARSLGEKNNEKGNRIAYTSLIIALVFGFLVGVIGFIFCRTFLEWMDTTDDVIDLSTEYLKIYFIGTPFSLLFNFGAALLRGTGDSRRPSLALLFSGIFNIGLNLLLVAVFNLDVEGVAIATIASQLISAAIVWFIIVTKRTHFFTFEFKDIKFHLNEAKEIFMIGLPVALQAATFSISNILIQSSVNSLGTDVVSGNGAANSIEGFIYVAMDSVGQSTLAFTSAQYGARNKEKIKEIFKYSLVHVFLVYIAISGLILIFRKPLLSLYLSNPDALIYGEGKLIIFASTYITCGVMNVLACSMRGMNHSLTPMIVVLTTVCGTRIIWIYTMFKIDYFHNLNGLSWSYPVSWVLAILVDALFFVIYYRNLRFKSQEELVLNAI